MPSYDADIRRQTRQILKTAHARLTGRERGPDHDPEGRRRVPRRDSYDVDDERAKPWSPVGDGSVRQGLAYREALIQAAKELAHQAWKDHPLRDIRADRARLAALRAELERYDRGEEAMVGRPAVARREAAELSARLDAAAKRMRRIDAAVLEALLKTIDFATGRLFPAIETIAARAGCHRNTVVAALRRLKQHGFVSWRRRTIRTGNAGEFGPQREQTSNAYFFEHSKRMPSRTWQRYWQLVVAKLRKIGSGPPATTPNHPTEAHGEDLRLALSALGASVALRDNAST